MTTSSMLNLPHLIGVICQSIRQVGTNSHPCPWFPPQSTTPVRSPPSQRAGELRQTRTCTQGCGPRHKVWKKPEPWAVSWTAACLTESLLSRFEQRDWRKSETDATSCLFPLHRNKEWSISTSRDRSMHKWVHFKRFPFCGVFRLRFVFLLSYLWIDGMRMSNDF